MALHELALFAGAGGGILGGLLLGWRTVAAVEIEEYPRAVLLQRQADGILPQFPIWDDIKTFDGKPWRGKVDVISGGFPCQDISIAGKGAGITGERSGLWSEMARIIGEVRPQFVLVENSPALTFRGLGDVLGDLSQMGYDAQWGIVGANKVGAPHKRDRIWIVAYSNSLYVQRNREYHYKKKRENKRERQTRLCNKVLDGWWDIDPAELPDTRQKYVLQRNFPKMGKETPFWSSSSILNKSINTRQRREERPIKPYVGRMAYGVAHRVDRLKAIGNGQVPAVSSYAFSMLSRLAGQ